MTNHKVVVVKAERSRGGCFIYITDKHRTHVTEKAAFGSPLEAVIATPSYHFASLVDGNWHIIRPATIHDWASAQ